MDGCVEPMMSCTGLLPTHFMWPGLPLTFMTLRLFEIWFILLSLLLTESDYIQLICFSLSHFRIIYVAALFPVTEITKIFAPNVSTC